MVEINQIYKYKFVNSDLFQPSAIIWMYLFHDYILRLKDVSIATLSFHVWMKLEI